MPKILIAEDYMFNYMLLQRYLKKINFEFVVCDNGEKAIEELKNQDFDIILMDIEMPVMNGIEAVKYIRSEFSGAKREIPIIALTGHHEDNYFENLNNIGFNDYMMKPFNLASLENKLNNHLKSPDNLNSVNKINNFNIDKELNLDYLYEFADGDKIFIQEMIDLFITNAPEFVERIKSSYQTNDWEKLRINAHKFSPLLAFFGLKSIIADVDAIEEYSVKRIFADDILRKIKNIEANCKITTEKLTNFTI